jgi:hypothetical protein
VSTAAETAPAPQLARLLVSVVAAVAAFDICIWSVTAVGASEAVFFLALAALILINRQGWMKRRTTRWMIALALGTALATLIEPGICNTLVWLTLIVALAGDTFFATVEEPWGRWLSQAVAMIRAPGRVVWLGGKLVDAAFNRGAGGVAKLLRGGLLVLPALFLTLIFGWLLASGNAVFGLWTQGFFNALWNVLEGYFDGARLSLWLLVALVVLPLLRPVSVSPWWWRWTHHLPRLQEPAQTAPAVFSSGLVLLTLNVLFLAANLADAFFLWSGAALPSGVTYSQFVHEGVDFLLGTVLLSALVLTVIFQQSLGVVRSRRLKALALFWIGQNLFLILSIVRRLMRYIEAYDMTVSRLGVVIFLLLVAAGYALLAGKVIWDRSLSRLIGGCVLAGFTTLYLTQFLNLAGWSADFNVAQWERNRTRNLDVDYLQELGPAAWPALDRAHRIDPAISVAEDDLFWRWEVASWGWREFYLRFWLNRWALQEKVK